MSNKDEAPSLGTKRDTLAEATREAREQYLRDWHATDGSLGRATKGIIDVERWAEQNIARDSVDQAVDAMVRDGSAFYHVTYGHGVIRTDGPLQPYKPLTLRQRFAFWWEFRLLDRHDKIRCWLADKLQKLERWVYPY